MITIEIPLEPYAQQRPRFARAGRFTKTYDAAESAAWKLAAKLHMTSSLRGIECPVFEKGLVLGVRLGFFFSLPKSAHRKTMEVPAQWHIGRMDFDNLAKIVCDAATGMLWHDDRQVAHATIDKVRVAQGGRKRGVEISVWELPDYPEREER